MKANVKTQDYLEKLMFLRAWYAFINTDLNVMAGLIFDNFATILVPLMSSLIKEQESTFVRDTATYQALDFYGNELANIQPSQWNLILGSVTAEDLHTGEANPWTNKTHAFRPFDPQIGFSGQGTLTAPSTAYAAHLSCEKVTGVIFQLDDLGVKDGFFRANLTATDRNCAVDYAFTISPTNRPLLFQAFHQTACGLDNSLTRILLLTATSSGKATPQLHNPTLISCITAYSTTSGNLTVSWANGTAAKTSSTKPQPAVLSFLTVNPVIPKKSFVHESFEADLLGIRKVQHSTTQDQVANTEFADFVMAIAAGLLPLSDANTTATSSAHAASTASSNNLGTTNAMALAIIHNPEVLLRAIPVAFASIYRVAAARTGMVPANEPVVVVGRLETTETRLWIRYWLMAFTVTFLLFSAVSTICLTRWWGWGLKLSACEQCDLAGEDGQTVSETGSTAGRIEGLVSDEAVSGLIDGFEIDKRRAATY
jgi:hypothetical protein